MPLTPFQRTKLRRMFAVLDVDADGRVDRQDFLRRVRSVAELRGWAPESAEYARNLESALWEWRSLRESADVNEDGAVTLEEYLHWGDVFLDDPEAVSAYARGDIQLLFDGMDTDGDNRITLDEYRTYLAVCGADPSAAEYFFGYADLDENGRISRAEMAKAVEAFLLSEDPEAAGNYLFGPLA